MLTITGHQGNANQNHNELYHLTPLRLTIIKRTRETRWWRCGGKKQHSHTVGGTVNCYSHHENSIIEFPQKIKNGSSNPITEYISKGNEISTS